MSLPEFISENYTAQRKTSVSVPVQCPLCMITPAQRFVQDESMAYYWAPDKLSMEGWYTCPCQGEIPFKAEEILLAREESGRRITQDQKDLRECHREDTRGRLDPQAPRSSDSTGSKKKKSSRGTNRHEQDFPGFPDAEDVKTVYMEKLTQNVKIRIPVWVRRELEQYGPTNVGELVRRLLDKHLMFVKRDGLKKIPRKHARERISFLMTPSHVQLFQIVKSHLGCSQAELMVAVLLREYGKKA